MTRACVVFRPLSAQSANDPKTAYRKSSPFRSTWQATWQLLRDELEAIGVTDAVIEVDVLPSNIRADGSVEMRAVWRSPRAALSFTHPKAGALRYPCDRFVGWQENVRAIALGLKALRQLERYGITTRGEQYRGWSAIPAKTGEMTIEQAVRVIADASEFASLGPHHVGSVMMTNAIRAARSKAHPDNGNGATTEGFQRVEAARKILEATR